MITSIAMKLCVAPALMGNVVLWKPSSTAAHSAWYTMELLREAGLPDGVINMLPGDGPTVGNPVLASRKAISTALRELRHAAGNVYINDKPTGAVVGQQPFGGSRASGTNDKSGSMLNLTRWSSPRTIKENFAPPTRVSYPFMAP